ncbi:MAG: FxsA family protein [Halobacteriales archaeon]
MRRWLFVGLLVIPLADILLLVWVAGQIGAAATVALVVLTALIGLLLVRAEGRHTLRKLQRRAAAGEVPTDELLDGALLVAAGAFLLTPGLVTDLVGLLLVVPLTRLPLRAAVKRWVAVPLLDRGTGGFVTGRVYTAGYPFGDDDSFDPFAGGGEPYGGGSGPSGPGSGGEAPGGDGPVDLGTDAYDIDIEERDGDEDPENGNA